MGAARPPGFPRAFSFADLARRDALALLNAGHIEEGLAAIRIARKDASAAQAHPDATMKRCLP